MLDNAENPGNIELKNDSIITPQSEEKLVDKEIEDSLENVVNEVNEVDEDDEAVNEIEKSVAENAENEEEKEAQQDLQPQVKYNKLTLEELVGILADTIENNPVQKIKSQIDTIKTTFNKKFGALLAEKKAAFLAEGGNSIDFQFSSPVKIEYNNLLSAYKKKRDTYYNDLETRLNNNLERRLQVIEDLKTLIETAEPSTMYKNFKEIESAWRLIGPVPKSHYNDTWKIYHHHVERFYDLLNFSNDFRDLDFRHNLEEKLKIIEKAEALVDEKDVNIAAKELQELHKAWKEDIGPVAKEMRENVWKKFSAVTKKIHDKRHDHFKEMRSKFQEIIEKKLEVVAAIKSYDTSNNKTHNDWQKSIKDIEKLRQEYFSIGKLPYSKSEEVWQKFKAATKKFNTSKNIFYKEEKNDQQENLEEKIKLIEIAESLKDSEDWEKDTNTMKKIQADWKKIGHVPRKFSDDIWKRFKSACNLYFERLHEQKNKVSEDEQAVVDEKKKYLDNLKTIKAPTKDKVLKAINEWNDLGKLPRNMRHLDDKFNKQVDKLFDEDTSLDKNEVVMLKFTNVVDTYVADEDSRKLDSEELFIRKKIDEVVREIQQLENNLGFFSNVSEDNPLVLNVKNKVNEFKENLEVWKQKLSYLKKQDY
ncbi:MAG: DUF349 domain-containing protein [Polaribacter sp.]|uniref:DUF349 domain-containing protein n=1 Tax=Polaribacter sp. TaxID=1920175 RepID=UPI003BAF2BF7